VKSATVKAEKTGPAKAAAPRQPVQQQLLAGREPGLNSVWQRLALGVQARLAVSAPDDPYEHEADRVADRIMRMSQPAVQRSCPACAAGTGTSACPECREKSLQSLQRRAEDSAADAGESAAPELLRTLGPGRPLDMATRAFMEPRFDHDFGAVRVHNDAPADSSARSINALAFTYGRDLVFRAGHYAPDSSSGRELLAHELAHVVQQGGSSPRLQRQSGDDFRVTQLQPDPQDRTRGMADRFFFELDRSDLRAEVPAEAAERARLESWATAHSGQHVGLVGRASQEGALAHNQALARRRAATVRAILVAHGVVVDGTPSIDMTFSQRPVDYRFYRSVEVIVAGSGDSSCNTFTTAQQNQDITDCESAFSTALGRAVAIANAAIARLRPDTDPAATPAPDRDGVLASRFPGIARTTVLPNFESVVTRLGQVGAGAEHICNHRCAPGCERPASAGAGGPLQLCAPFYIPGFRGRTITADERVFVVMHETTHSAVIPGSSPDASVGIDFAYSKTRLFGVLEGSEALHNTDSYVVTLLTLARTTGSAPAVLTARGVAPVDDLRLVTPAGETGDRNRRARRAIGFAESWLNYASFWTPHMYDFVAASLAAWSAGRLGHNGHAMLELFAPLFQLQHPGTAAIDASDRPIISAFQSAVAGRGFATPPVAAHADTQDRTRIAGIYDRLTRMHRRLHDPLVVARAASGDGSWSAASGLPGLGTQVQLADDFFTALTPVGQSRHVIRLMARALSDVGSSRIVSFV
jgi:outer membrane protein OmpA-like peptidoglycan-associated protein